MDDTGKDEVLYYFSYFILWF